MTTSEILDRLAAFLVHIDDLEEQLRVVHQQLEEELEYREVGLR